MSMPSETKDGARVATSLVHMVLAGLVFCLVPAYAATEDASSVVESVQSQGKHRHKGHSLDDRVRTLAQSLDLDAEQQSELRKVLQSQREEIMRVWSDTSVPAPYRVSATLAISDRTADQIRALLNDEQKKKYSPPRARHEPSTSAVEPNVEAPTDAVRSQ